MKINTTKYRQVAEYLSANMNIIDDASSFNEIAKHINDNIKVAHGITLNTSTISTIVYAVVGTHDHMDGIIPA